MEIIITLQIPDGNLGDGWINNYDAAVALAKFTEETWSDDLCEMYQHDIEIDIDVLRRTTGGGGGVGVIVEPDDDDDKYEMQSKIESLLTDQGTIWRRFLESDAASMLFED